VILGISFLYVSIAAIYLGLTRRQWQLNPSALFVFVQLVLFLGMLPLFDIDTAADRAHMVVCLATLCLFVAADLIGRFIISIPDRATARWFAAPVQRIEQGILFNWLVGFLIVVSIGVCVFYYNQIGYNFFLESLRFGGPLKDASALRLETYASDRYLGAGYVNQFKNFILPLLLMFLVARYRLLHTRFDLIVVVALSPLCLLFLLGTGQRAPLFLVTCTAMMFFNASLPAASRRVLNVAATIVLCVFLLLMTAALGRTTEQLQSWEDLGALTGEIVQRFTSDNQQSAVVAFRYVYDSPPLWLDGEWVKGLQSAIPGHERGRPSLASEVFFLSFHTLRGTSPASIWGVVWLDSNAWGICVLPIVLGLTYRLLYARLIRGPKTLARLAIYAALCVCLGTWCVGGPDALLNDGLFTIILLMGLFKLAGGGAKCNIPAGTNAMKRPAGVVPWPGYYPKGARFQPQREKQIDAT
jgi:hypothetical protein